MRGFDHELEQQRHTSARHSPERGAAGLETTQQLASAVGNQAFGAFARPGAGILPDGRAHPAVESAIAATRGSGHALDESTRARVGGAFGDPLADVRLHTDEHADRLAQSVSARAFTTGSDVFFAQGEYSPGSSEGQRLLTHELSHVVQQRGASSAGPLEVSQPRDALEVEADSAADELSR